MVAFLSARAIPTMYAALPPRVRAHEAWDELFDVSNAPSWEDAAEFFGLCISNLSVVLSKADPEITESVAVDIQR